MSTNPGTPGTQQLPTELDALEIANSVLLGTATRARRFTTGIAHWVYEVRGAGSTSVVVRLGTPNQVEDFVGAVHWSNALRPLGVPLPSLLAHGEHRGLPYLILERLPGQDLESVYGALSSQQRYAIVEEVQQVQDRVRSLPLGRGYGFARLPEHATLGTWDLVVESSLARSRARIRATGLASCHLVDRLSVASRRLSDYFSCVQPTPFLDDTTTKNVLVYDGRLTGVVDVDWICYGDPLFTVGLTRAAILAAGANPDYTEYWSSLLSLSPPQVAALDFYTALFCANFVSEVGHAFNGNTDSQGDQRITRLESIALTHLAAL